MTQIKADKNTNLNLCRKINIVLERLKTFDNSVKRASVYTERAHTMYKYIHNSTLSMLVKI